MQRAVGVFVIRHYRLCAGLVLALMASNVVLGLVTTRIDDSDEARYGVSAFEMLHSRSFLVTTYAGQPEYWNLKPPLGYWLIAGSYWLFGSSAVAMRLPSALFALAVVAATMGFCRRWCNRRQAILAGLVLATSFGFLGHHGARSGDLDACLTFTLLLLALQLPRLADSPWRILLLGPLLGCGFLLKSFAILPMIAVGAAYGMASGSWRKQRLAPCLVSLAALLLIVLAWAGARSHADGSSYFVRRMVREDLLDRSTTVVDRGKSSPLTYVMALGDRFAPWPLLIGAAAALSWRDRRRQSAGGPAARPWLRRRRRREVALLVGLWIGIPLLLFSLARTQHHWYIQPIYPACAILAAPALLFLVGGIPRRMQTAALLVLVALPLGLCEARVLHQVLVRDHIPASQRFLYSLAHAERGRCRELWTTFPLRHSERFILEVVDGFRVVEGGGGATPAWPPGGAGPHAAAPGAAGAAIAAGGQRAATAPGICILASRDPRRDWDRPHHGRRHDGDGQPPAVPGWALARQSDSYALFAGGAGGRATAGAPSGPVTGGAEWMR